MSADGFDEFFVSGGASRAEPSVTPVVQPAPAPEPATVSAATPQVQAQVPAPIADVAPTTEAEPDGDGAPEAHAALGAREEALLGALNHLMEESLDIEAAALVSLDGFTMASALPEGMHEERVGAMSAAILGLGERAAAELGRGALSQVFIEGDNGYVLLMAAGSNAVLTCMASKQAKLGLVIYDMRAAAADVAAVLD